MTLLIVLAPAAGGSGTNAPAGQAAVTVVAQDAQAALGVNAAQPGEALAAQAAVASVGAQAAQPAEAAAAQAATAALGVNAGQPTETVAAQAPTAATGVNAGQPSETVTAQAPAASVGAQAAQPTTVYGAFDATVSTANATNAPAGQAAVTVTAYSATVAMGALAQAAAVTVTAFDAAVVTSTPGFIFRTPTLGRSALNLRPNRGQHDLMRHYGGTPKQGVAVIVWPDDTVEERRALRGDEHLTAKYLFTGGRENPVPTGAVDILQAAGYTLTPVGG